MNVTVAQKNSGDQTPVRIQTEFIKLESALKLANLVSSGGEAKQMILDEQIQVNGEVCTMRGKKLYPGDTFLFQSRIYVISNHEAD